MGSARLQFVKQQSVSTYQTGLGLTEAFSIIIGRIIGSGIFRTPASVMLAVSGYLGPFFAVWILGGFFTFLSALLYSEMVAMLPKNGGPYVYLRTAFPPVISFLRGWAMFFVSETASIVVVSIVFSEYSSRMIVIAGYDDPGLGFRGLLSLGVIWSLTGANMLGVRFSGLFQDVLSLVKMGSLAAVIIVGTVFDPQTSHFAGPWWPDQLEIEMISGMAVALRYVLFSYSGWEGATYVAEEVKNPAKNLPRSLFAGIGMVMLLYIFANIAYVLQLSSTELIESASVAAVALERAAGNVGGLLISLAVAANTFGNVNSQIFTKSRTWQAMARDGLFFRILAPLSRSGVPAMSLLFQALWATVLLLFAWIADYCKAEGEKSAYDRVIDFFTFTSAIFNFLTFYAVFRLRKLFPEKPRPFRTPAFLPVFLTVILIQIAFAVFTFLTSPFASLAGLTLTSTGLIYWHLAVSSEVKENLRGNDPQKKFL